MMDLLSILLLWLQFLSTVAVTRVTNLTFVNQALSWTDARQACRSTGGHLVQILDETKNNVVSHTMERHAHTFGVQGALSLDLASLFPGDGVFYWTSTCQLPTWTRWGDGMTNKSSEQCAILSWRSATWNKSDCDSPRVYMCEHTSDMECPFEEIRGTRLWSDGNVVIGRLYDLSLYNCLSRCKTWKTGDGRECWAAIFEPDHSQCKIFFTFHPYLVTNSSYLTSDASWTLYVRRCYNVFEGGPFNTTSSNAGTEPLFDCGEWNASSTRDMVTTPTFTSTISETSNPFTGWTTGHVYSTKTTAVSTTGWTTGHMYSTKTTAVSTTSSLSQFRSSETSSSVLTGSYRRSTDMGSTPGNQGQKRETTLVIDSSSSSHRNQSAGHTQASVNLSTSPTTTGCLCPCLISLSVSAKNWMVRELLTNLTIKRTQLSSYRRKYSSAQDDRPVAVCIGWAGIVCLVICFGVIIFCDATALGRRRLDGLKKSAQEAQRC